MFRQPSILSFNFNHFAHSYVPPFHVQVKASTDDDTRHDAACSREQCGELTHTLIVADPADVN
jgi:hypothetical protein